MPGRLLRVAGPPGAGKSQFLEALLESGELDVVSDLTSIWAALRGLKRGPDGKFPVRLDTDPALPLAQRLKLEAVRQALQRGLRVAATSSTRKDRGLMVDMAAEAGAAFTERIVDPGRAVVAARLAGPDGSLSGACSAAIGRWYDSEDLS